MQDRAKRTMFYYDLGKDAKINPVRGKHSMVPIAFFWEVLHLILNYSTRFFTQINIVTRVNDSKDCFLGILHTSFSYASRNLTQTKTFQYTVN